MPTSIPVDLETMNYACVVFVGIVAISGLWYLVWGHKNYVGPPSDAVDAVDFTDDDHPIKTSSNAVKTP